MTPDRILAEPPRVLTQAQREGYFRDGYLLVERLIPEDRIAALRAVTDGFVERSRAVAASDEVYDLAPGHGPDRPRVRRLKLPDRIHPLYWDFAQGMIADVAADLLGPDVLFHHAKLNFKWAGEDAEENAVAWHQDIQFYPHTNYSPLTIGTYLTDTAEEDGPVMVLPGSQEGPLYELRDAAGAWTGCLRPDEVDALALERAVGLPGPAGSITVHNCRTLHASRPSRTASGRPLLLNAYAAADALPYTPNPSASEHDRAVVRGRPARWAVHDPRPCPIPPDWSGGYTSIFAAQAGEDG